MMPTQLYRLYSSFLAQATCVLPHHSAICHVVHIRGRPYTPELFLFIRSWKIRFSPSSPIKSLSVSGLQKYLVCALRLFGMMLFGVVGMPIQFFDFQKKSDFVVLIT